MHRPSSTPDLRELLDTVAPKVESAMHAAADHIPASVVDRLPDKVVDHLPISRPRRGRKLLLLGLLAGLAGVGVAAARRTRGSAPGDHRTPVPPRSTPVVDLGVDPTSSGAAPDDASGLMDPSDPRINTRSD